MGKAFKNFFQLLMYAWLRFDPILRLAFGHSWKPRYEFMKSLFGEKDTRDFLAKRKIIVEKRKKKIPDYILPSRIHKETKKFLETNPQTLSGLEERKKIIDQMIFWAVDPEINSHNIESYKTRSTIVGSLLGEIFQNALADEVYIILKGIKEIVFSKITYLGSKGEPSPIVHDVIIKQVSKIIDTHFSELDRIQENKLQNLTKVKLIQEIKKDKAETGSLAFSGSGHKNDPYRNKYPLEKEQVNLLIEIIHHYQYSSWPDSRETAIKELDKFEKKLGFSL